GKYDLFTTILHEVGHLEGIMTGYSGFDRHVVQSADGTRQFLGAGFTAVLTESGSELDAAAQPLDLMNPSPAPGVGKLRSTLDAQLVTTARHDARGSGGQQALSSALYGGDNDDGHTDLRNGPFTTASTSDAQFGWSVRGDVGV